MVIYDYFDGSTRDYNYVGPVHFVNTVIEPVIGNPERAVGGDRTRWKITAPSEEINKVVQRLEEEKLITDKSKAWPPVVQGPMGVIFEFEEE